MSDLHHSVTAWIGQVQAGDPAAAQQLWQRYWSRLVELMGRKITGGRVTDEEDVSQEAFDAFFRAARAGRFPQLADRGELWQLLVRIAENKLLDQHKQAQRRKRGGGRVRGDSVFNAKGEADQAGFDAIVGSSLTPEFIVEARHECERLLDLLADASLKQVALLKLQGYSHEEIAARMGCVADTVGRKLALIRTKWTENA
jgi:RNA polymerase sigma factor (sigma-70 family)